MAKVLVPVSGVTGAATLGFHSTHWLDRNRPHARARQSTRGTRGEARSVVQAAQADAFDRWPLLSASQRSAWAEYSQLFRRVRRGRVLVLSPQLTYAARAQAVFVARGVVIEWPIWPDPIPSLVEAAAVLDAGSGMPVVSWSVGSHWSPDARVDVWLSRPARGWPAVWSRSALTHESYFEGQESPVVLDVAPAASWIVALRVLSPGGRAARCWYRRDVVA